VATLIAIASAAGGRQVTPWLAAAGIVAVATLVRSLQAGRPASLGPVVGALGVLYVAHVLLIGSSNALEVSLAGVGLLLVGELGQWSIDGRERGTADRSSHASRAIGIVILVILGLAVAFAVGAALRVPLDGGPGLSAVGVLAAVGLLAVVSVVALRSQHPLSPPEGP
jgi:hypothetical protein